MRSQTVATAIATAVLMGGWVAGAAHADPPPAPGPPPGPPPAPGAPPPGAPPGPAPAAAIDKDGKFVVGKDIQPGAYHTAGPTAGGACYWKRLNGDKIVDNALSKKEQTVVIEPTDTAFQTNHCQPWQLTDCTQNCGAPDRSPMSVMGDLGGFLLPRAGVGGGN